MSLQPTPMLALDSQQLKDLFPFYIWVDEQCALVEVGRSLHKAVPNLDAGTPLEHCFRAVRPDIEIGKESLSRRVGKLQVLEAMENGLVLRGQIVPLDEGFVFLGSPWVTSLKELSKKGLQLRDFAPHDPLSDFLLLLQTVATSVADTKQFANKLKNANEDLLEAKNEADAANRAKSEFLAVMSHEIRTPLNAILGMTDLLSMTELSVEQNRYLGSVAGSSETLLALINDVLDFSKIEAGQVALESVSFDMVQVLEDVVESFAGKAERGNVDLCIVWEAFPPRKIWGDAARLRQILFNLLGNALKFTEEGHVLVRVASDEEQGEGIWSCSIAVEDTGVGIAPEKQERVFERFVQAERSVSRTHGGTGLGLSITRSLVEMMEGRIEVESQLGRGSSFVLHLSFPTKERECSRHFALEGWEGGREVVFWGDPSVPSTQSLLSLVESSGLSTSTVGSLEAIAEKAKSINQGAWVLMIDAKSLEPLSESDSCSLLKGLEESKVPYILLNPLSKANQAKRGGTGQTLFKPVRLDALREALVRVGKRERLSEGSGINLVKGAQAKRQRRLGNGEAILVVEDNENNQLYMEQVLRQAGYSVTVVGTGAEGVEQAQTWKYQAVIMDLDLPDLSGLEASERIRKKESKSKRAPLPILALTAHALKGYRDRCLQVGMNDYLTKPIQHQSLLETLASWIEEVPTVLVVDDYEDSRMILERMLQSSRKYRVLSAEDGAQALQLASSHGISAVFLDMELPDIKGWELVPQLRQSLRDQSTPIIATTGHDSEAAKARIFQAGCDRYLCKPLRRAAILEALEQVVGG